MVKVITYGTYDLLHYGHIRLLQRAKALGDYLIVGVTTDSFDRARGKINVEQSLMERIEALRATGIADKIIVEEYEGQKIDDIRRYDVDIFTVGSDWQGKFDYLNEFCKVVYLDRTQGVSSSELRAEEHKLRIGLVGESPILNKFANESRHVNGVAISGLCSNDTHDLTPLLQSVPSFGTDIEALLDVSDALYVISTPRNHYAHIRHALGQGKHVLAESPIAISKEEYSELTRLAREKDCILMDGIKTAYSMAYNRLVLLAKSGIIGKIVSVDATCTSLYNLEMNGMERLDLMWNSIGAWGPTAMLPIFQILGTDFLRRDIVTRLVAPDSTFDTFTKIAFVYPDAVASLKVGQGVKSEGELIVSGTKGYIYVPAPWWKTDYFEVRFENPSDNKRYFYQLDGEGIRYEIVSFLKAIQTKRPSTYIDEHISETIVRIIEDYYTRRNITTI